MTTQGLMDILLGKLFQVYIMNLMGRAVNLPRFMTVACVSIAPTGIIHVLHEEHCTMSSVGLVSTQYDFKSTVNTVHY